MKTKSEGGIEVYTASDFQNYLGKTVEFRTPWGLHRGTVKDVNGHAVLMEMPEQYVNASFQRALGLDVVHAGFFDGYNGFHGFDGCFPHRKPFPFTCCWIPFIFIVFVIICPWFWCW